jgi:hypothetical protein
MSAIKNVAAAALLSLAAPMPAEAAALVWNLDNVVFTDGGGASGSFTFDSDTGVISTFSIAVSGGNTDLFPALTYSNANSVAVNDFNVAGIFNFRLDGSTRQLRLAPATALTNAGATVNLDLANLFQAECFNCLPFRRVTSGALVASTPAVPEPGTWAMMLLGFGAMGFALRRRPAVAVRFA